MEFLQYSAIMLGLVSSVTASIHCHTAAQQWVVEVLWYKATLLGSSGHWNYSVMGNENFFVHPHSPREQRAPGLLYYTTKLPRSSGHCN